DFGFNEHDVCLNIMPLCHINSTFFTFTFLYIGGTAYIHPARSFRAGEILEIIQRLSQLVTDLPTIQELDLNPIVAFEDRAFVVDVRIGI
ncbi:MAG: acetate--CoA ligase family protein, partial [Anaerolineae bacterium]